MLKKKRYGGGLEPTLMTSLLLLRTKFTEKIPNCTHYRYKSNNVGTEQGQNREFSGPYSVRTLSTNL